jgi:pyrimidine deaminase RibD-like protein
LEEEKKTDEEPEKIESPEHAEIKRKAIRAAISEIMSRVGDPYKIGSHVSQRLTPPIELSNESFYERVRTLDRDAMVQATDASCNCVTEDDKKEPTPMVGAALVKDGKILEVAYRGELGQGDHAEFTLLEKNLKDVDVTGATLYTTLEPCTIRNPGKTPCVDWIINHGIAKVFIGMLDPNPEVCGLGQLKLRKARILVSHFEHDLVERIEDLNKKFSDQFPIEERLRRLAELREVGPNGYRVGIDEEGNKVEWLPDEEDSGERLGMILRRNDNAIATAYNDLWEKIWWYRHKQWLRNLELGVEQLEDGQEPVLEQAKVAAKKYEEKYGDGLAALTEPDWDVMLGQMSALSWVMGSEWEESMDT